jgi:hypothetical protein
MLNVFMLNVDMLSVVMLNVVAPKGRYELMKNLIFFFNFKRRNYSVREMTTWDLSDLGQIL